ncbi:pentatricopeptide repeat-containing protein At1g09820-like [Miscanthus floridulus]|uniref:pentatricopeptide repeat-containing protein At1g09820-like n=1 Tax=Miscanthus floridulus TaxID=154761 RepID=UPI0034589C7C
MALSTLLAHLAAGRFARALALTSGGGPTHRVLHLLLHTSPPPPLPRLVALARWSRAHFRAPLPLRLHALLLACLASDGGLHSLLRSELHALSAGRLHSPASILRALRVPASSRPLVADMLVLALARASQPLAAYDAFLLAGAHYPRYRPSAFSVLASLVRADRVDLAERAFRTALRRRVSPDSFTFNIVISGLCKTGQLLKAGDVAKDIRGWGLTPSVVTYNTLINGYCKRGRAGKMYHVDVLLKEMNQAGISPDLVTVNVLINGYFKESNITAAIKVFEEMRQHGIPANVVTYNSLVSGLCREGKVEDSVKLVEEMEELGLACTLSTQNSFPR